MQSFPSYHPAGNTISFPLYCLWHRIETSKLWKNVTHFQKFSASRLYDQKQKTPRYWKNSNDCVMFSVNIRTNVMIRTHPNSVPPMEWLQMHFGP